MADDEQSKGMTLNIPGITDFFSSIWAKMLAVLTAISIVLGIALEVQAFITGYYVLQKTVSEAKAAAFQPALIAAQLDKAQFDAKAAAFAPDTAAAAASKAKNEALVAQQQTDVGLARPPTEEELRAIACSTDKGRRLLGAKYGCPP